MSNTTITTKSAITIPSVPPTTAISSNSTIPDASTSGSSGSTTTEATTNNSTDDSSDSLNVWVPVGASVGGLVLIIIVVIFIIRKCRKNNKNNQPKELPKLDRYGLPEKDEPQTLQPRSACPDNVGLTDVISNNHAVISNDTTIDTDRVPIRPPARGGSKRQRKGGDAEQKGKKGKAGSNNIYANVTSADLSSTNNHPALNSVSSIPSSPAPAVPLSQFQARFADAGTFDAMYIPMDLCNPASPRPGVSPAHGEDLGEFESVYTHPENPPNKVPSPTPCGVSSKVGYVNIPDEEQQQSHPQAQAQVSGNHYQNYAFQGNHDYGNLQENFSTRNNGEPVNHAGGDKSSHHTPSPSSVTRDKPPFKPKEGSSQNTSQSSTPKSSRSGRSSPHMPKPSRSGRSSPHMLKHKSSPKPLPKPVLSAAQQLHIASKSSPPMQDVRQESSESNDYMNAPSKKEQPRKGK